MNKEQIKLFDEEMMIVIKSVFSAFFTINFPIVMAVILSVAVDKQNDSVVKYMIIAYTFYFVCVVRWYTKHYRIKKFALEKEEHEK